MIALDQDVVVGNQNGPTWRYTWLAGWLARWMDGWMDGQTDRWMDRWMPGQPDRWMHGPTDDNERLCAMDGWMDGWTFTTEKILTSGGTQGR